MSNLQTTCLCGTEEHAPIGAETTTGALSNIEMCHCYGCRHSTGQLYASYYKILPSFILPLSESASISTYAIPSPALRDETVPTSNEDDHHDRVSQPLVKLYFCTTCGCHIFRSTEGSNHISLEVATGTLTHGVDAPSPEGHAFATKFGPHINVGSTVDGGMTKWTRNVEVIKEESQGTPKHYSGRIGESQEPRDDIPADKNAMLSASCLCQRVTFGITRPNIEDSIQDAKIEPPTTAKWWLDKSGTKYMATLCACKSCRLASGFEIQSWAFMLRTNVMFKTASGSAWEPVDFNELHRRGILCGYESSPGVMREFCPGCGATVFWHDKEREPEVIDVSVGLLQSYDGARAESWLHWWTAKVSFAEDATLGRHQAPALRARLLVEDLEQTSCALRDKE